MFALYMFDEKKIVGQKEVALYLQNPPTLRLEVTNYERFTFRTLLTLLYENSVYIVRN